MPHHKKRLPSVYIGQDLLSFFHPHFFSKAGMPSLRTDRSPECTSGKYFAHSFQRRHRPEVWPIFSKSPPYADFVGMGGPGNMSSRRTPQILRAQASWPRSEQGQLVHSQRHRSRFSFFHLSFPYFPCVIFARSYKIFISDLRVPALSHVGHFFRVIPSGTLGFEVSYFFGIHFSAPSLKINSCRSPLSCSTSNALHAAQCCFVGRLPPLPVSSSEIRCWVHPKSLARQV